MVQSDRFSHINPLLYRYLPNDPELQETIKVCYSENKLQTLENIVIQAVLIRLDSLDETLSDIAHKHKDKYLSKRIDGVVTGKLSVGEIFYGYQKRLAPNKKALINFITDHSLSGLISQTDEAYQNDRLFELTYLLVSIFTLEANIADNIRHSFFTELNEYEHKCYDSARVGSSAMPHKKNPVEFENIKSLWKHYCTFLLSAAQYAITDYQRDSTNQHFLNNSLELSVALSYSTKFLKDALENIKVNYIEAEV